MQLTTTMRTAGGKVWSHGQDVNANDIQAVAGVPFRRRRGLVDVDLSHAK
ncbi:MAG: hypothetical protein OXN89_22475 [Bryobacterales bacterium]|nr:hypothetical protein [Bryobacterales bacterium]